MKMKKHLTLVLSLILIVCMAMFFVACGDDPDDGGKNPPPSPSNPTVTLNRKNLTMILGDETLLSAVITNGQDDYSLTWATSDASVVSVEDGNLEALKQGNAQITATYSNGTNTYTDSAQIAVTLGDNIPVLFIENKTSNDWNFVTGSEFELVPFVQFNNKKFYDVSLAITSSDTNVIGVEGNKLLVLAQGTAKLEIVATWRGVTFDGRNSLKLPEVDVSVVNDIQMSLNGDTVKDIQLYTRDEFYGVEYATSTAFELAVKENGVLSNLPVDIQIADEKVAKYEDGVLSKVGFGETIATLTWTSSNNVYQRTIKIYVDRPIVKYDQVIENFSAADGAAMANLNGSFKETTLSSLVYGTNSAVLVDASQRYIDVFSGFEVVAPLVVEDNLVKGVYTHHEGFYDVELTIGTATEQYIVDVKAATKLFAQSNINEWKDTFAVANSLNFADKYRYGYFALLEDVSGISIGSSNSTCFAGTFDGRGHVFSDIEIVGAYGLFSNINDNRETTKLHKLTGTTFKNVAFTDVTFASNSGNYLIAEAMASNSGNPVTVDNVYVQINEQATFVRNTASLTRYCYYNKFNNVIVEYPLADTFIIPDIQNDLTNFKTNYEGHGSLFSRHFTEKDGSTYNGKNVYVISKLQLSINNCVVDNDPNTVTPNFNSIDGSNVENTTAHRASGYYRYETIEDMKAANNDYTSFMEGGNGCWIMVDGIPAFRSLVQSVYLKDANDNALSSVTVYSAQDTFTAGIVDKEGEELEDVVISANDSRIKINGNVITVEDGFYSAMLTVSSADGIISRQFPVLVNTNTPVDFNEELLLNKADDKIYFNGTELEDAQIYAAFYNGTLVYSNDKILSSLIDKPVNTAFTLKVYTLDGCYNFTNVKMYDQVWENTKQSREAMVNFFRTTGAARTLDGYYVLAENLTFFHGDEVAKLNASYNDYEMFGKNTELTSTYDFNVFSGTLDGRGYTLNDIGLYAGAWSGMFGIAGDGATIKNIAFSQACQYASGSNVNYVSNIPSLMFHRPASVSANIYFENVYVDLDLNGATRKNAPVGGGDGSVVFYKVADGNSNYGATWPDDCGLGNLKWNNVIMDINYIPTAAELESGYEKSDKSILCGLGTIYGFKTDDVVKNTYFITNGYEGRSIEEVTASADADIVKYASMTDMIKANNNYDSFDSKYWNTITGVPMWKTTNDIPYLQDAEGNYVESIIFDEDGATEGLTFTAGVFSALGNTTPVVSCDNPNVVINGNMIEVKPGKYTATITVANVSGTESLTFKVSVNTSLSEVFTEEVLLERASGKLFFQGTTLEGTTAAIDMVIVDKSQACATSFVLSGVVIEDQKYKLTNVKMYDKVWENTEESRRDMAAFFSTYTGAGAQGPKEVSTLEGYYTLAEDLVFVNVASEEAQAYTFKETFYSSNGHANTFSGTFDGRGFAMYNIGAYGNGGMFGLIGSNATIKNVAIINPVTYAGADSPSGFGIKAHKYGITSTILFYGAAADTGLSNINISDVYVEYTTAATSNESVFVAVNMSKLITGTNQVCINNFIINRLFIESDYTPATWVDNNADGRHDVISNAIWNEWAPPRALGANVTLTNSYLLTFGRTCGGGGWHFEGFVNYKDYATFSTSASTLDLTSFANSNWTVVENSAPTWASLAD